MEYQPSDPVVLFLYGKMLAKASHGSKKVFCLFRNDIDARRTPFLLSGKDLVSPKTVSYGSGTWLLL